MDIGISVESILQFMLPTLFSLWPVLVLAPLGWNRTSINQMIAIWVMLVIIRVVMIFMSGTGISLMPEPVNTVLFSVVGLVLIGIALLKHRSIDR